VIEITLEQLIARLKTIQTEISDVEKDAFQAAAEELRDEARAALDDDPDGIGDHIEITIEGNQATIGVPAGPIGDAAVVREFGDVGSPPESFLGRAAFVHGERIASGIAENVGRAMLGLPPLPPKK
jgi:hypothetical protein